MRRIYTIMFAVSMALVVTAIVLLVAFGLRLGVDFRGGTVVALEFTKTRPAISDMTSVLQALPFDGAKEALLSPIGTTDVDIRTSALTEEQHQQIITALTKGFKDAGMRELRFDSVGPAIGTELRNKSIQAIVIVLFGIGLYIAFVFRAMRRTLSWWVMSFATMVALVHDVIIPVGVFALLGHFAGVEIEAVFVAAILTIMGYSISDTVVVFDRVRENIVRGMLTKETTFAETVHRSIMQTLVRSLNTNITTILSLVAIFFFGGASIRYFALALIVGIFCGAYSSIFIASPLLVWLSRGQKK